MARGSRVEELAQVQVDMTPMIDVIFNLIIFFMLINRFVQDERVELEVPIAYQAKETPIKSTDRVIINVEKDGRILIGGERIPPEKLEQRIALEAGVKKDKSGASERQILIRGDVNTKFKHIQQILWICATNKIYKVSFAAQMLASKQ